MTTDLTSPLFSPMTEDKYYQPSIEEFHIGFEYQFRSVIQDGWQDAVIKDGTQIDDIHHKNPDGSSVYQLQTKYLNPADIEELGFTIHMDRLKENISPFLYATKTDYPLWKENKLWMVPMSNGHLVTINQNLVDPIGEKRDARLFIGTIKNKRELKKLLSQLGI